MAVISAYCICTHRPDTPAERKRAEKVAERISKHGTIQEYKSKNRHSSAVQKTTTAKVEVKDVKIPVYVPNPIFPPFTNALAGTSAYLRSASVIALLGLAATSPDVVYVGASARVRRKLPPSVRLTDQRACACVDYEGVRSQPVAEALETALREGALDGERVMEAAREAVRRGLISRAVMKKLTGEHR